MRTWLWATILCWMTACGGGGPGSTDVLGSMESPVVAGESGPQLSIMAGKSGGYGNRDADGANARFWFPSGAAADASGDLYIADNFNHVIRKFVPSSGTVTTIAGSAGQIGSTDGVGSAARFSFPTGVAGDGSGTLYVTDARNFTVRKIVLSTGEVTTIAGKAGVSGTTDATLGTDARFRQPFAIAADGSDTLYVSDVYSHTIRRISLSTGTATVDTLAGSGSGGSADGSGTAASFNIPSGLALDGSGYLYVADTGYSTIRQIQLATAQVRTIAGTAKSVGSLDGIGSSAQFYNPSGVAADGAGNLYIADLSNHTIRKIVIPPDHISPFVVSTVAGTAISSGDADGVGASARFNRPTAAVVDGSGNLHVVDRGNHTIRKIVLSTAEVSTVAGDAGHTGSADGNGAAARFTGVHGIASDAWGNVYVSDSYNHTIRKIVLATGEVTTIAGKARVSGSANGNGADARFNMPAGIVPDGFGNLYVADTGNHTIRRIDLTTGAVTTTAGSPGAQGSADGFGSDAGFSYPYGIAVDGPNSLYVADSNNHTIRKIAPLTGEVTTIAGKAGTYGSTDAAAGMDARFRSPYGLASDGAHNLYVADSVNNLVRKVDLLNNAAVTTVAGALSPGSQDGTGSDARFRFPYAVAMNGLGCLYVADRSNHTIRKILLSTGEVSTVVGAAGQAGVQAGPLPAAIGFPSGVCVPPSGELLFTSFSENCVLKVQEAP